MGFKIFVRGQGWVGYIHHVYGGPREWSFTTDPSRAFVWKTYLGAKRRARRISNFAEVIECE